MRIAAESGEPLGEALAALLPETPELPYANFAPVAARPGAAVSLHRAGFEAAVDDGGVMVARDDAGHPRAAVRFAPRPFESDHFGLRMARIEPPIGPASDPGHAAVLLALYQCAFDHLAETGYDHVAARTSTRDRAAPWVLQQLGAFHVDTQVSWMAKLGDAAAGEPPPLSPDLRIETHDSESIARLDPSDWKALAEWGGHAFDRGPLVFDHDLPLERAHRVYQAWTEQVMTGAWADAVLIAREGRQVVAFISMRHMPDVSTAAGVPVFGRGLGATLPHQRGLFTAIQREMIATPPLGARYMENETQAATTGSIQVYAKLGFRYLRATSTFHWKPASRPRRHRSS